MKSKSNGKILIFYLIFFIVIIIIANSLISSHSKEAEITYSEVVKKFQNGEIKRFYVDDEGSLFLSDSADPNVEYKFVHRLASIDIFYQDLGDLIKEQIAGGVIVSCDYEAPKIIPWWVSFLPYLILIIVFVAIWWVFISRTSKNGGGMGLGGRMNSFSKARTKLGSDEAKKVMFTDVAGADEEKEELQEIVEFLKNPSKYNELGARIPKGVLLVGAPGTGKTLLAKAVAGESGVPFYSISGSDFVEMYVGVGASRVRDLFETAKKSAPCIIFIDEIDAVGRHRGAGLGGGHDEREQTLNQLLVEMDGFGGNDGVIVMAATNRPDILDPALLRPGRFDRQVTVNYPDIKGREEILKVHARNKPIGSDVDFATVAKSTSGFSGADLANLLNEAALLAARKKKSVINIDDIEEATIKVLVGPQKKSMVLTEEEKRKTAYHEAGHAIVTHSLKSQDPVHQISIIPSGRALGYTLSLPEKDKVSVYKQGLLDTVCVLLGGRAAEKLMLDDISAGASNDMERATDIARKMVTQYGMSDKLGPVVYSTGHDEVFLGKDFGNTKNYSEEVAAAIDKEIYDIVVNAYNRAIDILKANVDKLNFITEFLVKYEIMDSEQFELCFKDGVTIEMLEEVGERKKAAAARENALRHEENKAKRQKQQNENNHHDSSDSGNEPQKVNPDDSKDQNENQSNDDFSDDIIDH